jgi:leader peptidase (prepilin peptidase)/N-methyltransferase
VSLPAASLWGAAAVAAAVPAGWGAALAGRRLAGSAQPPVALMIAIEALLAASAAEFGPLQALPALLVAGWLLGLLAVVDVLAFRLPDLLTAPLAVAGLLAGPRLLGQPLMDHVVGAAGGFGVLALLGWAYERLRGREGLGLGDAKLLGAAGAWLGWTALPMVVVLACAGGLAWAAARLLLRGRAGLAEPIAFGAPLCAAIWIALLIAVSGGGGL